MKFKHFNLDDLLPGDIILTSQNTPSSWLIRLLQSDCDYSHACIYMGDNTILTTGANRLYWSGYVNADTYLSKQSCIAVCRTSNPLRLITLEDTQNLLVKKPYGTFKLLKLISYLPKARRVVLGSKNYRGLLESNFFCSELVANAFNYCFGKQSQDVVTPENIYEDKIEFPTIFEGCLHECK